MASVKNRFLELLTQKYSPGRIPTNKWLAERLGMTENQVGRWLRNEISRFDNLPVTNICEFLGCEVGDLLYLDRGEEMREEVEPA